MARGGGDSTGMDQAMLAEAIAPKSYVPEIYIADDAHAIEALKLLQDVSAIELDIETADHRGDGTHNSTIRTIQLRGRELDAPFVFDLYHLQPDGAIPLIMRLLRRADQRKSVHSLPFETRNLLYHYGVRLGNAYCTEKGERMLRGVEEGSDPKQSVNLAATLERRKGVILDKTNQTSHWGQDPMSAGQIRYAGDDVRHLESVVDVQIPLLQEHGLWEEFQHHCNTHLYESIKASIHAHQRYRSDDWPRLQKMVARASSTKELEHMRASLPRYILAWHHRHAALKLIDQHLDRRRRRRKTS